MKCVIAKMFVATEGVEEVLEALPALVSGTRSEEGNHAFLAHQSKDDPTVFGFYEQFTDDDAHDRHSKMPHVAEILSLQEKYGKRDIEVTVWEIKEPV